MSYIFYKESGEIICTVSCSPSDLESNLKCNAAYGYLTGDVPNTADYFVSAGILKKKPEQPTQFHKWDHVNNVWLIDILLAGELAQKQRSQLLVSSDWTQLPDVPLATKEAWATYRQALRDITLQSGYPTVVVWPVSP